LSDPSRARPESMQKVIGCPIYRDSRAPDGSGALLGARANAVHINATAAAGHPSLPLCPDLRRDRGRSAARRGGQWHVQWPACRCNGPRLWRSPEQVEFVRSLPQEQPCQNGGGNHVGDPDVVGGIVFDEAISRASRDARRQGVRRQPSCHCVAAVGVGRGPVLASAAGLFLQPVDQFRRLGLGQTGRDVLPRLPSQRLEVAALWPGQRLVAGDQGPSV